MAESKIGKTPAPKAKAPGEDPEPTPTVRRSRENSFQVSVLDAIKGNVETQEKLLGQQLSFQQQMLEHQRQVQEDTKRAVDAKMKMIEVFYVS